MRLFSKQNDGNIKIYNILGLKFSKKKKLPSELSLERKIKKLKAIFSKKLGYELNLDNPQTFNEKINWYKLFYHNDLMTKIVDKYEFKNYIKEQLGEGYTVPLLGVWDNVDDIDFDKLPNRFVLKCNAQSSGNYIKIVKDKAELDIKALKAEMQDWLKPENTLKTSFCWAYYNVPLKIIAEEYIDISNNSKEYKVFCFNGKANFVLIELDYFGNAPKRAFYDRNFIETEFKMGKMPKVRLDTKPKNFDKMIEMADNLASQFPFVRVDFYDINGKIYCGEMTFYSGGGYSYIEPLEWDKKIGDNFEIKFL